MRATFRQLFIQREGAARPKIMQSQLYKDLSRDLAPRIIKTELEADTHHHFT